MHKLTVYGLPITPASRLEELAGASFCLSFATTRPSQEEAAIRLVGDDQILMLDNGAFSHWRSTGETFTDELVDRFEAWALSILERCPQAIAVIPDVIQGSVEANEELRLTSQLPLERSMPVWHLDEPIERLLHLCEDYEWIAFGSTIDKPGSPAWHARIKEAFAAIDAWELESDGACIRPRIHMMRAQAFAHLYPFDSSDSTNLAVNFSRQEKLGRETFRAMADRIDGTIQASAGDEAEHQVKRPILGHVAFAEWQASFWLELELLKAELGNGGEENEAEHNEEAARKTGKERGIVASASEGAGLWANASAGLDHGTTEAREPRGGREARGAYHSL